MWNIYYIHSPIFFLQLVFAWRGEIILLAAFYLFIFFGSVALRRTSHGSFFFGSPLPTPIARQFWYAVLVPVIPSSPLVSNLGCTHAQTDWVVLCIWAIANSITAHFTDLGEVLGPHLDLFLHKLLPVEGFILQPLLRLLPPPPFFLQHLTASQALPLLEDRAFIKYFFWSVCGAGVLGEKKKNPTSSTLTLRPELSLTFIHLCTSFSCLEPLATGRLLKQELWAICRSNMHGTKRVRTRQKRNAACRGVHRCKSLIKCIFTTQILKRFEKVWAEKEGFSKTIVQLKPSFCFSTFLLLYWNTNKVLER